MSLVACGLVGVLLALPPAARFTWGSLTLAGQAVEFWQSFHDCCDPALDLVRTESWKWQAAEAIWSQRLADAQTRFEPTPAGRLAAARLRLERAEAAELRYDSLQQRALTQRRVALAATLERLDAGIAVRWLTEEPTAALRWHRLAVLRRLAGEWRADRLAAMHRPAPDLRTGEWVGAEADTLDQLVVTEAEVWGSRPAERRLASARELERFYADEAAGGRASAIATALATLRQLDAERAAGGPAGSVLWRQLVVARTALAVCRQVRANPGCLAYEPDYSRTELVIARHLATARRAADPSPAGRLVAARGLYLSARELEVRNRAWAELGLVRMTVDDESRWPTASATPSG